MLTGSKNALKGVGFFVGGLLLTLVGFRIALLVLMGLVLVALVVVAWQMRGDLGVPDPEGAVRADVLEQSRGQPARGRPPGSAICLPRRLVRRRPAGLLRRELGWSFWIAGGFLAVWTIGYGIVQASAPQLLRRRLAGADPDGATATRLAFALAALPALIALALSTDVALTAPLVLGLLVFGLVFALNSAVHSYLILAYADGDKVAMNVGFYYMANAAGRLSGTLLSGALYQWQGLQACLWASVVLVLGAGSISLLLTTARTRAVSPPTTA